MMAAATATATTAAAATATAAAATAPPLPCASPCVRHPPAQPASTASAPAARDVSLVTDPSATSPRLMFDIPHDDLDGERAAVVAERDAAETGAAVGLNASSDVDRFVRGAASLRRTCGAAASRRAARPCARPRTRTRIRTSPPPHARARVGVHRARTWHLSACCAITESGGTTSLGGDRVWCLDPCCRAGLPGLSAHRRARHPRRRDSLSRRRR